jgi:hypothetical protein
MSAKGNPELYSLFGPKASAYTSNADSSAKEYQTKDFGRKQVRNLVDGRYLTCRLAYLRTEWWNVQTLTPHKQFA